MKKITRFILISLTTLALLSTLSGCKKEEKITYMTPIDGWEDITIPVGSKFVRTSIAGKVENHEYQTPLSTPELMSFLDEFMTLQSWTAESSLKKSRTFIKNGDLVQFTAQNETDTGASLFVLIEPKDAYGAPTP